MQGGGGEGQMHREEVAGIHQELARSPSMLVLQLFLWGHSAHIQGWPSEGGYVQQPPPTPSLEPRSYLPPRC